MLFKKYNPIIEPSPDFLGSVDTINNFYDNLSRGAPALKTFLDLLVDCTITGLEVSIVSGTAAACLPTVGPIGSFLVGLGMDAIVSPFADGSREFLKSLYD